MVSELQQILVGTYGLLLSYCRINNCCHFNTFSGKNLVKAQSILTKMGSAASVSIEEIEKLPQYEILGGQTKFHELKGEDGK